MFQMSRAPERQDRTDDPRLAGAVRPSVDHKERRLRRFHRCPLGRSPATCEDIVKRHKQHSCVHAEEKRSRIPTTKLPGETQTKPGSNSSSVRCGIGSPGATTPPITQIVRLIAIQQPRVKAQTFGSTYRPPFTLISEISASAAFLYSVILDTVSRPFRSVRSFMM
jgi:hypothetical protein